MIIKSSLIEHLEKREDLLLKGWEKEETGHKKDEWKRLSIFDLVEWDLISNTNIEQFGDWI
jgi:protein-tyrosine phosphatase